LTRVSNKRTRKTRLRQAGFLVKMITERENASG
jgi:hypothetical protein